MDSNKLNITIHDKLIPIQQKFIYLKKLSYNPQFHFNGNIFNECIQAIQEIIEITRELAEFANNDKEK